MLNRENNCDCSKVPFSQECTPICIERVLSAATVEEKQLVLGFSSSLAHNIKFIYQNRRVQTFDDIVRDLRDYEIQTILIAFRNLNQYQLNYFNKSQEERAVIIETLKRLDLGNGENRNEDRPQTR
jgi:hypothetical protein